MRVRLPSGKQFEASADRSLLCSAEAAGISLLYSCRTRRCSTCKGRVADGATAALHDEQGLTPREKSDGWVLTCVRVPVSDVQLEIEELADVH